MALFVTFAIIVGFVTGCMGWNPKKPIETPEPPVKTEHEELMEKLDAIIKKANDF